jgi:sigma-B regulation protein RsbU (phosphoserine phosphatase)
LAAFIPLRLKCEAGTEQRRMRQELRVAAEIQANLLPHSPAHVPGYDLAGRTQSSEAVGGDFYDLAYDGSLLHLALGDVAGKGVGAAMLNAIFGAADRRITELPRDDRTLVVVRRLAA